MAGTIFSTRRVYGNLLIRDPFCDLLSRRAVDRIASPRVAWSRRLSSVLKTENDSLMYRFDIWFKGPILVTIKLNGCHSARLPRKKQKQGKNEKRIEKEQRHYKTKQELDTNKTERNKKKNGRRRYETKMVLIETRCGKKREIWNKTKTKNWSMWKVTNH